MEVDDNELVRRVLDGDLAAYRTIVERHQGRIFYVGLKFLHSNEDAEDFAQEVFLRAFERLGSYRGSGSFAAWLYRVAFNLAVNRYRGVRPAMIELAEETLPDTAPHAEERLLSLESADHVRKALEGLPDRYAIVVKMHFFDELSYPEIAEALDLPVNTVKSHVFRAKAILRTLLEQFMED